MHWGFVKFCKLVTVVDSYSARQRHGWMWFNVVQDASEISSDLRKAEIFINNRGSAETADGTWVGWENIRCALNCCTKAAARHSVV